MPAYHEIRATYDRDSIVVYQAYNPTIARAAVQHQRFVPPFSLQRMTWIKPSFLWMMERSNWARKSGQEHVLAVRLRRAGWDEALALGVLTAPHAAVHASAAAWERLLAAAPVHVQWDPERSLRGEKLPHRSIQVGLSRRIVSRYVEDWVTSIEDITAQVHHLRHLCDAGHWDAAKRQLPVEKVYEVGEATARRLEMWREG